MKLSTKKLFSLLICLCMVLLILLAVPAQALTPAEIVEAAYSLAEGEVEFETKEDAMVGESITIYPEKDGKITVEILSCDPGFYYDIYTYDENGELVEFNFECGKNAAQVCYDVTAGKPYYIWLAPAAFDADFEDYAPCAGSISYKVTCTADVAEPIEPDAENPKTGDTGVAAVAFALMAATAGVVILKKKEF